MNIVSVQPGNNPHFQVFDEVRTCLLEALRDLGLPVSTSVNKIVNDETNIFLGWHLLDAHSLRNFRNQDIVYNFEPLWAPTCKQSSRLSLLPDQTIIWDYDSHNVEVLREFFPNLTPVYVPFSFHPSLIRKNCSSESTHDVVFYGSLNERRIHLLTLLESWGFAVKTLFNVYKSDRNKFIDSSKLVLNIHFGSPLMESPRLVPLWSNRIPVVSETCLLPAVDSHLTSSPCFYPYSELADACASYISCRTRRLELADAMYEVVRQHPYTKSLCHAIEETLATQGSR